jgi:L-rhamnose mutarotase
MENKKQGYKVRKYQGPVKRYCQMLNLKNDAALIAEYRKRHSERATRNSRAVRATPVAEQ